MNLDVLMMLGNGADCDASRGDGLVGWDGSGGLLGVALIGVGGWG